MSVVAVTVGAIQTDMKISEFPDWLASIEDGPHILSHIIDSYDDWEDLIHSKYVIIGSTVYLNEDESPFEPYIGVLFASSEDELVDIMSSSYDAFDVERWTTEDIEEVFDDEISIFVIKVIYMNGLPFRGNLNVQLTGMNESEVSSRINRDFREALTSKYSSE